MEKNLIALFIFLYSTDQHYIPQALNYGSSN